MEGLSARTGHVPSDVCRHLTERLAQAFPGCAPHVSDEVLDWSAGDSRHIARWSWPADASKTVTLSLRWRQLGYCAGFVSSWLGELLLYRRQPGWEASDDWHIEGRTSVRWHILESPAEDFDAPHQAVYTSPQVHELLPKPIGETQPACIASMLGSSPAFIQACALLKAAAPTRVTVLLTGETGVGKERFANALHQLSPRADQAFVAVNCAALPLELIESELFGAERGSYTGAHVARAGRIERADGGTLLLDEIGELPPAAQAKLLRVLQSGEVERLGTTQVRKVDVRIIAATNVDLEAAVQAGRFRADLLYRLDVYRIHIPPLRERGEDVELMAKAFLTRFSTLHGKRLSGFSAAAIEALCRHPWPGNIRELENRIERAVILTPEGERVSSIHFPSGISGTPITREPMRATLSAEQTSSLLQDFYRHGMSLPAYVDQLMLDAVANAGGNLSAAARKLGITRPQLSYRLSQAHHRSLQAPI